MDRPVRSVLGNLQGFQSVGRRLAAIRLRLVLGDLLRLYMSSTNGRYSNFCYASLTRRERQVMALIVSGLLNKQVGGELGISEITVKAQEQEMKSK